MPENPRIEELRRRVQKDPASIAFAQLAEEHRRAGDYDEAIRVSRTGLAQHPGYLSARVTLGRALLETGEYEDAQNELEQVLRTAPDNLAAIRALAEIHQRRDEHGATPSPPAPPPAGSIDPAASGHADLAFAGSDEQFAQALETLDAMPRDVPLHADLGFAGAEFPFLDPATAVEGPEPEQAAPPPLPIDGWAAAATDALPAPVERDSRALAEFEAWLAAIIADRQARSPFTS